MSNLPAEIKQQLESTEIKQSTAEKLAEAFAPPFAELQEQAKKLEGLDPNNPEHAAIAKRVRIDIGHICSEVAETKRKNKATINKIGKYIDGLYNTVDGFGRLTQDRAKDIEQHAENIIKKQQEQMAQKRNSEFAAYYEGDVEALKLGSMPEDVYTNLLNSYKDKFEEAQRLKEAAELQAKEEAERQAKIAAREREIAPYQMFIKETDSAVESFGDGEWPTYLQCLERRKKEYLAEQERVKQEKEAAEKQAAEEKAAREKAEAEAAKIKAELEAKKKAEEEAAAKAEAERKAQEEAARKAAEEEAKRPVKEKILNWVNEFKLPTAPEANDERADLAIKEIAAEFSDFLAFANEKVNSI